MKENNNYNKNPDVRSGPRPERRGITWLGLIISLFFFLIFILTKDLGQNATSVSPPLDASAQIENTAQAFLEVNGEKLGTAVTEKENIYDLMVKLREEGKIDFKDKNYSGMGKLIEEINGVKNSAEKNWIYYVNGKKADIGVSNYKINKGDIVSWKYEKDY